MSAHTASAPRVRRPRAVCAALALALTAAACAETAQNSGRPTESAASRAEARPAMKQRAASPVLGGAMGYTTADKLAMPAPMPPPDRERYEEFDSNPVHVTAEEPVSTFSADVDTASYTVMRRYLNNGALPPGDAVRVEEFINYFSYDYTVPRRRELPFEPTIHLMPTPWNPDTQLLHIGVKGFDIPRDRRPAANLVLLLDVSGSMSSEDKLPLVKKSIRALVEALDARDSIAIAVYAGAAGTVLEPTPGNRKSRIYEALDKLSAGGSTAGGAGIELAYRLAQENFDKGKINRVILATDGDFNVGISDPAKLEDFVVRKRDSGVFLTVLGYGTGNYHDVLMQKLAQSGNGNAAYIDSLAEARKVLVDEMAATLFPIAKDVKIQVEFNPARVSEYRLVGYETRLLNREDFNNDKVDAGDIGSGHTVTAIYEIVPAGSKARLTDPLRYGKPQRTPPADDATGNELAFVKIRYKLPDEDKSRLITRPVLPEEAVARVAQAPDDARFAAAVAAFGQHLRGAEHLGEFGLDDILALAQAARGQDRRGYRAEFVSLVRAAKSAGALASTD